MDDLIIPRGMDPAYYRFMQIISDANGTKLIIDRRRAERRQANRDREAERRQCDRRINSSGRLMTDGFVTVPRR